MAKTELFIFSNLVSDRMPVQYCGATITTMPLEWSVRPARKLGDQNRL